MNLNSRPLQAPESYGTFWDPNVLVPLPTDGRVPPVPRTEPAKDDAYLEFVNVTEDTAAPSRADRR